MESLFPSKRLLTIFILKTYFLPFRDRFGTALFADFELRDFRQRSFNWQSIAFVMRRLWVQIPPLAFTFYRRLGVRHSASG